VRRSKSYLSLLSLSNPPLEMPLLLGILSKAKRISSVLLEENGGASVETVIIWTGMLPDNTEDAQLFVLASHILSSRLC